MRIIITLALVFSLATIGIAQGPARFFINGSITNQQGKPIKNAKVDVLSLKNTFLADKKGVFLINIPKGDYLVRITATHYKPKQLFIALKKDTAIHIMMETPTGGIILEQVKVLGRVTDKVMAKTAGTEKLDKQTIARMPALLGEKDPLKALQLLPGIVATAEGSADMSVRGGGADQNMLLLDNVPLYSSSHLFGLYSPFNPLAISSATIYKGDFPAYFGGRIASVTSLATADTLAKTFTGVAEPGLTTGKMAVAVPLFNKKSALYIAGRRSYYDLLAKLFSKNRNDEFKFQDYNINWVFHPNGRNKVKLMFYNEADALGSTLSELGFSSGVSQKKQTALGLNWQHRFNASFVNDFTVYHTTFNNHLAEEKRNSSQSYRYVFNSAVADVGIKNTLSYTKQGYRLYAGVDGVRHAFRPTDFVGEEYGENFIGQKIQNHHAVNANGFAGAEIATNWRGKFVLGLRNSHYYNGGWWFHALEPRFSYHQFLGKTSSLKLAYAKISQPVHRLANTGLGLPQDIILSANRAYMPQIGHHFSAEFAHNFTFGQQQFALSWQPFYKQMRHIISFNDGYDTRSLIYGAIYEAKNVGQAITTGNGRAFGIETMLEKKTGKLNGWINYTYLKASHQFANLNGGLPFSPGQDRRHTFNMVLNWQVSPRWHLGLTWMFISGQPVNLPQDVYALYSTAYANGKLVGNPGTPYLFTQGARGTYRMKPFHKLDVVATYKFKLAGRLNAEWNIGLYNIYNRFNPSFYYLSKIYSPDGKTQQPVLKSVSVFPALPATSLSVQF